MFFTFLNKDELTCPDCSLLMNHPPEEVLFYYYHERIVLPIDTYFKLKELSSVETERTLPVLEWTELFDKELEIEADMQQLLHNDYVLSVGPYYYPPTNSRFYFTKQAPEPNRTLLAEEFASIQALAVTPVLPAELQSYYKSRKNARKSARNKDDLLRDIQMCLLSLQEIEKLNKHLNYLNKLLEQRYATVQQDELLPAEPDNCPEKPQKPEENATSNLITFAPRAVRRKKQYELECSDYNHKMKVYLLCYREYEKACDRYKNLLEDWEQTEWDLRDRCFQDIEAAELRLQETRERLTICNGIITRSYIHTSYQDIRTLTTFKQYVETGRAADLQDCMNLFEEEKHWDEIKASQERIENTIYFMQNSDENACNAARQMETLLEKLDSDSREAIRVHG